MNGTESRIWEPQHECMNRAELEQLQLERLEATLNRVYRHVPFYRKRFDELGFNPDEFRSLADLARLPFTTKADLRENHPYGLFAVPLRDIVRVHASSGTTGLSTAVGYTRNDMRTWSSLTARVLVAGGVTKEDVVQIAFDYGLFTGAFGLHQGAERLGASVVPVSSANARRQVGIMRDYRSTALVTTPSHALNIADAMIEMGVNPASLSLEHGLFGAEPWSESMRDEIEDKLEITATDNYGLSEVMGPGVAGECLERSGLHLAEDHFLFEVIDPETLAPLPPGKTGELVVTTLTKEGIPVVRYRTRDLTAILDAPCPCGRTSRRMARVKGRTDDMLIAKGAKVFPSEIEAVLFDIEGTEPHYQVQVDREAGTDLVTVLVEVNEALFFDEMKRQTELRETIVKRLATELGVTVDVKLVGRKTLERTDGKARRVVDRRRLD
ncbi:MAG TPA: phenylacetate--CoA ligase [Anaeromyxobacter sp.]|nr:phenylacetate--CoA ligase [Anaeromyxobacter sp.]